MCSHHNRSRFPQSHLNETPLPFYTRRDTRVSCQDEAVCVVDLSIEELGVMSTRPIFLSVDNVLYLHADTIKAEGGCEGIRDLALLESAVLMPQQQFGGEYLHADLPAMAAAYLFHICCNHPFLDGNKRTAAMAAFVFLDANRREMTASEAEFEHTVLQVAAGSVSKDDLTDWVRVHSRPRR